MGENAEEIEEGKNRGRCEDCSDAFGLKNMDLTSTSGGARAVCSGISGEAGSERACEVGCVGNEEAFGIKSTGGS